MSEIAFGEGRKVRLLDASSSPVNPSKTVTADARILEFRVIFPQSGAHFLANWLRMRRNLAKS
ncbi:hypothetical protein REMIM1_CH01954 [Rhizobium etli bv. mimosae str. Mim1]|nr:hypothetical protein REMIM1_CH01954 [Rhizobium etli bv. mimosae str. Mim1]